MTVHTLRWDDASGRIEMIDQRVLPARFDMLSYDSAAGVAEAIRSMVVRGAPAIGCAAAYGIALEARRLQIYAHDDFFAQMTNPFDLLPQSRPTAVNLFWALQRMRHALEIVNTLSPAEIAKNLLNE